jgi:GNAT superfamily N-acetyltransferase
MNRQNAACLDELRLQELEVLSFILPLSRDYPGIEKWFLKKVAPGMRAGSRFILPVHRYGKIVAVGIAKNDGLEKKICTVRVAPTYEGRGLGVRVFDGLLRWLNTDRPSLTVSERNLSKYSRLFDYYGFMETSATRGVYLPHSLEHGFNESLKSRLPISEEAGGVVYPLQTKLKAD